MRILILTFLIFAFISADAQTASLVWVKVANEGDTVTFSASAAVRYGAAQGAVAVSGAPCATVGGCWVQTEINSSTLGTVAPFTIPARNEGLFSPDPIVGTVKELDVLQTAVAQQITVNGKAVTVPAKGTNYVITCTTPPLPTPLPATTTATCTVVKVTP